MFTYATASATGIAAGLLVTALFGWGCEKFLKLSVTVKFPPHFDVANIEKGGGGKQLGVLERVLFFGSLWLGRYEVAAGWLAFKVAAKWAAWQNIMKMPDQIFKDDIWMEFKNRNMVGSYLVGRFLNGTLYNIICAAIGWTVGTNVFMITHKLAENILWWAAGAVIGALAVLILSGLPDSDKHAA